jgi:heme/copper-type cytochrome/quinol oxidase subunit 2
MNASQIYYNSNISQVFTILTYVFIIVQGMYSFDTIKELNQYTDLMNLVALGEVDMNDLWVEEGI